MRARALTFACLLSLASTIGAFGTYAQDQPATKAAAGGSEKVVSGVVQKVDEAAGHIVIDGQTYVMVRGSEGFTPNVGQKVIFIYEDRNGENVVLGFRLPSE